MTCHNAFGRGECSVHGPSHGDCAHNGRSERMMGLFGSLLISSESRITSMCAGQSSQVCCHVTIMSHRAGSWPWSRNLRVSNSNSMANSSHPRAVSPSRDAVEEVSSDFLNVHSQVSRNHAEQRDDTGLVRRRICHPSEIHRITDEALSLTVPQVELLDLGTKTTCIHVFNMRIGLIRKLIPRFHGVDRYKTTGLPRSRMAVVAAYGSRKKNSWLNGSGITSS